MTSHQMARAILIKARTIAAERAEASAVTARVDELKELAEHTVRAYDEALAASGLPRQHFNLRLQLLGRLPAPRKGLLPPPSTSTKR